MQPNVHIVCVDLGVSDYFKTLTIESLNREMDDYPGVLTVGHQVISKADPGGGFLRVAAEWVESHADIVGFIPYGFLRHPASVRKQVKFMQSYNLVGSYGDVCEISAPGRILSWEKYRDFCSDMITAESLPMETFLFDRVKFEEVGGFDHLLAGSYRPNTYITAMVAMAGAIRRIDDILVDRMTDVKPWGYKAQGVLAWDDVRAAGFSRRLKMEKFALDARESYRKNNE